MRIKDETIEAVRSIPISEVIKTEGGELKKVGREYQSLCVWHNDSNPSLTINDDKGLCFCFVCGGGSDSIDYVQQLHGLTFAETIEHIASRNGVDVRYDEVDNKEAVARARQKRAEQEKLLRDQSEFCRLLGSPNGFNALKVLRERGVSDEAIKHFNIGYSEHGHFSNRITLPIYDHKGQLVGFTGRRLSDTGQYVDPQKYKNSSASLLFDKSRLLFNESNAVKAARTSGSIIFVEGHFDVVTLWQQGIENVVATQGTSSPLPSTIERLKRNVSRFILCFDADEGGVKAIEHFMKTCSSYVFSGSISVSIAAIPSGKDPDQCVRDGVDFQSIIDSSSSWFDWQIDRWLDSVDRTDSAGFSATEKSIRSFVDAIQSPALRQFYIDKVSSALFQDKKSATKIAREWITDSSRRRTEKAWFRPDESWTRGLVEKRIVRMFIHFPGKRESCRPLMQKLEHPAYRWLWERIVELENCSSVEVDRGMVMAVICCCEPELTRALRPLVLPTIRLSDSDAILEHAKTILSQPMLSQDNSSELNDAFELLDSRF